MSLVPFGQDAAGTRGKDTLVGDIRFKDALCALEATVVVILFAVDFTIAIATLYALRKKQ